MKTRKKYLIFTLVFFVLSAVFTVLLLTVNRTNAGVKGTAIGLSSLNLKFKNIIGQNELFDTLSDLLLLSAFLVVFLELALAVVLAVKRKSIIKIDKEIWLFNAILCLFFVLYIVFDKLAINYRPILEEGEVAPSPSYPSTHVFLIISVLISAVFVLGKYVKNEKLKTTLIILCVVVAVLETILRLVSGVHYLTDILGGALFGLTLSFLYAYLINLKTNKIEE